MVKAIFFDFDGVLMNSTELIFEILQGFLPDYTQEDFQKTFHTNVFEDEKFVSIFNDNYDELQKQFITKTTPEHFFPFAKKLINDLSKTHKLYIISGTETYNLKLYLDLIESTEKFTKILGSDISTSKSERFEMLFSDENLSADDCLFITDSLGDIIEANEVGLKSIGVTWGVHEVGILEKGEPYKIISCEKELEKFILEHE